MSRFKLLFGVTVFIGNNIWALYNKDRSSTKEFYSLKHLKDGMTTIKTFDPKNKWIDRATRISPYFGAFVAKIQYNWFSDVPTILTVRGYSNKDKTYISPWNIYKNCVVLDDNDLTVIPVINPLFDSDMQISKEFHTIKTMKSYLEKNNHSDFHELYNIMDILIKDTIVLEKAKFVYRRKITLRDFLVAGINS